jgi:dihydroxyacid dehydratase/phosphogluconate dehydratase
LSTVDVAYFSLDFNIRGSINAARGPCLGHVSPEAWDEGPLAYVEDGDVIVIDPIQNKINLPVSE